jgi:hypothetical protein
MRPSRLLVALLCLGLAPAAEAATTSATSSNWAGYAAHRSGVRFHSVTGTWTVPTVDCSSQTRAWSANWIGLGGYSTSSNALEQTGTEADCDAAGHASYSSW